MLEHSRWLWKCSVKNLNYTSKGKNYCSRIIYSKQFLALLINLACIGVLTKIRNSYCVDWFDDDNMSSSSSGDFYLVAAFMIEIYFKSHYSSTPLLLWWGTQGLFFRSLITILIVQEELCSFNFPRSIRHQNCN